MLFLAGWIHMPSAVILAIFTLGFWTRLDISKHTYSCKKW